MPLSSEATAPPPPSGAQRPPSPPADTVHPVEGAGEDATGAEGSPVTTLLASSQQHTDSEAGAHMTMLVIFYG